MSGRAMLGLGLGIGLAIGVAAAVVVWMDKDGPGGPIIVIEPEPAIAVPEGEVPFWDTKWKIDCNGLQAVRSIAAATPPTIPARFLDSRGAQHIEVAVKNNADGKTATLLVTKNLVLTLVGGGTLEIAHSAAAEVPQWKFGAESVDSNYDVTKEKWDERMLANIEKVTVDGNDYLPPDYDVLSIKIRHNKLRAGNKCN